MGVRIEEVFEVQAPPDRVWAYLTDPRQVVHCLPGAELTSVQDESTFLGKVKVKVGPIVAAYAGKVVLTERDDAQRIVRMVGEGRESSGAGSAKMTMTSTVTALENGVTQVHVSADIDIVGRIAQFGRGMIESVNKQMFRQFTDCVRATLTTPAAESVPSGASAPPASEPPGSSAPAAVDTEPSRSVGAAATAPAAPAPSPSAPLPVVTSQPVRLLPVLFRALWDLTIGRLFRRPRGRAARP